MRLGILGGLLAVAVALPAAAAPAKVAPRVQTVTFSIRNRVFHEFRDVQSVRVGQDFGLGDTDFSARVVQYVPDFEMDLASRKVVSRSDQPNNPAFKVVVRKGKGPQDTTWAFLNMPPHFGRKSFFAFHVIRIDFTGHAPIVADTTATSPPPDTTARAPHAPGTRDTLGR